MNSGGFNLVYWGGWWRLEIWFFLWIGIRVVFGRRFFVGLEFVVLILEEVGILESLNISKF